MNQLTEDLFQNLISKPKTNHSIEVSGANIFYQKWGYPSNPGIVLVHGSGANSHWWDFVAPLLTDQYEVAALDLTGMGNSDHRESYTPEMFGKEILAVAENSGFFNKRPSGPIICGHSLGGYMSIHAANLAPKLIKGVIMIDSPIRPPDFNYSNHKGSGPIRKRKTYPNRKTILERFKLAPKQPIAFQFIVDYLAKNSIQEINGGFEWKFDDTLFTKLGYPNMPKNHAFKLPCPLGYIYGEKSALVTPYILKYMKSKFKRDTKIIEIKNAYHHVLLDKPIELAEAIKKIGANW